MGHKIFISYKFHDTNVQQQINHALFEAREFGQYTPRDYVNVLEKYIKEYSPHYYKAEEDNQPLDGKSDEEIWEYLKEKMFYSTLTIIMISPNMFDKTKKQRDQWIPREIRYSLGFEKRLDSSGNYLRSNRNAMMAIVLPDRNGKYDYYFEQKTCCDKKCVTNKINTLFYILRKNTFNLKVEDCYNCDKGTKLYCGNMHSFIPFFKWSDVADKPGIEKAINLAYDILSQQDKYNICLEIEEPTGK